MTYKSTYQRKLDSILNRLDEAEKKAVSDEAEAMAKEMVAAIKPNIPRDRGILESSIDHALGDPPETALPNIRPRKNKRLERINKRYRASVFVGGRIAPHAYLVEHGSEERFTEDGSSRGVMPPQPFFYPIVRAYMRKARRRMRKVVREELKRVIS